MKKPHSNKNMTNDIVKNTTKNTTNNIVKNTTNNPIKDTVKNTTNNTTIKEPKEQTFELFDLLDKTNIFEHFLNEIKDNKKNIISQVINHIKLYSLDETPYYDSKNIISNTKIINNTSLTVDSSKNTTITDDISKDTTLTDDSSKNTMLTDDISNTPTISGEDSKNIRIISDKSDFLKKNNWKDPGFPFEMLQDKQTDENILYSLKKELISLGFIDCVMRIPNLICLSTSDFFESQFALLSDILDIYKL